MRVELFPPDSDTDPRHWVCSAPKVERVKWYGAATDIQDRKRAEELTRRQRPEKGSKGGLNGRYTVCSGGRIARD
jgi:hypothetical protein